MPHGLLPDNFLSLPVVDQVRALRSLPPEKLAEPAIRDALSELDGVLRRNPLQAFAPHSDPQREFLGAKTTIVLALAGNRFGKTTSLTVRALVDCVDVVCLPASLKPFKRWFPGENAPDGVFGRIVNPSLKLNESIILPAFQKWVPRDQLYGKSWAKAYAKQDSILRFANGSFIEFMAYEQDLDKFGGAARHFVGYDEPPPRPIRNECKARTMDYGGYEMFAMTPIKANAAWVRRSIVKKREAPHITVVRGSIHDNPLLDEQVKKETLEEFSAEERQAREFGDFMSMGGLAYPDVERCVIPPLPAARVREWDHLVVIDPGVRNCGITLQGFTRENVMVTVDEALVQDGTPTEYVEAIIALLGRWGIPVLTAEEVIPEVLPTKPVTVITDAGKVSFVVDPAARQRGQVNAETVADALSRLGVHCEFGQNDHEAGVQQLRERMRHGRYQIFSTCRGTLDELEDVALEDREDGVFKLIRGNDHRADTCRYGSLWRPFSPVAEQHVPDRNLGWRPNVAPPSSRLVSTGGSAPPMGSMS